jgi:arylsulfatase A-like enzyme
MKIGFLRRVACLGVCASGIVSVLNAAPAKKQSQSQSQSKPNILFVIMDDVGIDQIRSFGYGGLTPPNMPVLDVVSREGIRFRNVWSMPECSPSRAMFFEGRYPLRTNIFNAILSTDLANSQVSPFETTTPKILREANYQSALFGKFHLAGPDNNPYKNGTPISVGFDYFDGFLEGAPHPIDTTAGGVKTTGGTDALPTGPYGCGFVPSKSDDAENGSDSGACYFADRRGCKPMSVSSLVPTPGRTCMEQGGVFVPDEIVPGGCQAVPPSGHVNFNLPNAYYVWNLVTNNRDNGAIYKAPLTDPRARQYSPVETTDAAVRWIKSQSSNHPWMATVSYATIHAPYQQAPQSLTPGTPDVSSVQCTNASIPETRTLSNQMLEAMDSEIGRLLVETGLAWRRPNGQLEYDPSASNTMLVIVGDNGTYAPGVKAPFDLTHAKGFVNQTGVWVPLIVAGPLVNTPDRAVNNMVNIADLYQLFGEIAGLDVRRFVPPSRIVDSVSMMPYLTNPAQPSLRRYNFTQTGSNITAHNQRPGPCVITIPKSGPSVVNTCVQIFPQKGLCEQEGGDWYGDGTTISPVAYSSCCALQQATGMSFSILPLAQAAIRNDRFKLIQVTNDSSDSSAPAATTTELQLYDIDETPEVPRIDFPALNLIHDQANPTAGLTPQQRTAFLDLKQELTEMLNSSPDCPADGNADGVVDNLDLKNLNTFQHSGSSWYDFNLPVTNGYDGQTDRFDRKYLLENRGRTCPAR